MKNNYEIRGETTAIFYKHRNGVINEALIDTEDLEKIFSYPNTWLIQKGTSRRQYCFQYKFNDHKLKKINLHRVIMNCMDDEGVVVDHINHNPLDNRKINLRLITQSQNLQNQGLSRRSKTGMRGVRFVEETKSWKVNINSKHGSFRKSFKNMHDALIASMVARTILFPYSVEEFESEVC